MGLGSGIVLATLGRLGCARLVGVDIDPDAIGATRVLLQQIDLLARSTLYQGSLWEPVGDERFGVVAANLPQFAATEPADPEHTPYWSSAGADGRQFMDPFLAGLRAHLRDTGAALIAHNVFLGRERTDALLASTGLAARAVAATSVLLHPQKAGLLNPSIRNRANTGVTRIGPYDFIDVEILEIRPNGAA